MLTGSEDAPARGSGGVPRVSVAKLLESYSSADKGRAQNALLPTGTNLYGAPARLQASGTDGSDSSWCVHSSVEEFRVATDVSPCWWLGSSGARLTVSSSSTPEFRVATDVSP